MKTAELNDYLEWNGRLYQVKWINPGSKSIGMVSLDKNKCPHCEHEIDYDSMDMIESSQLFQENATPIKTIKSHFFASGHYLYRDK